MNIELLEKCQQIIKKYNIDWEDSFLQWNLPSHIKSDLALNFSLAISYKTKCNVQEISKEIIEYINEPNWIFEITKLGHINIILPNDYYKEFLINNYLNEGNNLKAPKKNKLINIEFVSANPTGYLHLAHFRQAFFGAALANILEFQGYNIIREYYINDNGQQINSLINSVFYFYQKEQGRIKEEILIEYPGRASQEVAKFLLKKWNNKNFEQLSNTDLEIWKKEILNFILDKIKIELKSCKVEFDIWSKESDYIKNEPLKELLLELQNKNLIYKEENSTFFKSSLLGDDKDRVIIKQNGEYTYFLPDIVYHKNKFQRSDRLINIWGADHHGYIKRLSLACKTLGYSDLQIILIQTLKLLISEGKKSKFSKRLGNVIELQDALKYIDQEQLKFFCLEKDANQPIDINVKLLKTHQEKTSLYYLQYAHARCWQILIKAKEKKIDNISLEINLLNQQEKPILNLLIRFPSILKIIEKNNKPHILLHYLLDLSKKWQSYYQNNIILNLNNLKLTSQKLLIVKNIQIILNLGFKLLGLNAPKNM